MNRRKFASTCVSCLSASLALPLVAGCQSTHYATGMLGRYDPATGQFKEWASPGGAKSQPYGLAIDANDRMWFVEFGLRPSRFVGFDPAKESFFSITEIASGGGVRDVS